MGLFGRSRYAPGTTPDSPAEYAPRGGWGSEPIPAPGGPVRSRTGRRLVVMGVVAATALLVPRLSSGDGGNGASGPYDLLGEVFAEPDRTLRSQGVTFTMTSYRAMSPERCPELDGCRWVTSAGFDVSDDDLTAHTWLLGFDDEPSAHAAAEVLRGRTTLLDPNPPNASRTIVFDPGRFVQLARVSAIDAWDLPWDERLRDVFRGLGAVSAETTIADSMRGS